MLRCSLKSEIAEPVKYPSKIIIGVASITSIIKTVTLGAKHLKVSGIGVSYVCHMNVI